jgi:hypothetical protein
VVALLGGWFWLARHGGQDRAAAGGCPAGSVTLAVTVDPDIAAPVRAAADRFEASKPVVRDQCVSIAVTAQPSAAMVTGFTVPGWDSKLGARPALWIPDSSRSIEQMRVPGLIEGTPASVAVSPIVLAVPDTLRQALAGAKLSWSDLPRLQQGSLATIGLSGWGGLRMALPGGDATVAAATAVGSVVSGADPLSDDAARSGQVISAVSQLAAAAPHTPDVITALSTLSNQPSAPIHAVMATDQQITAKGGLAEFRPTGAAPFADHPAALLAGSWVDNIQNAVASVFVDYLRAPPQQTLFTDNGFQVAAPAPTAVPSKAALNQIIAVLSAPVLGVQSTVLIDTSAAMGTSDGSLTRLANTLGAVQSTLDTMPPDFGLGVWAYAHDMADGNPYQVLSATGPLTQQHRTALATALGTATLTESRTDHAYPTLEAAYRSATTNWAAGRANRVVLITSGPADDSTITGNQLISDITAATDTAHPVHIDVIVVGGQGTPTLQTLAQQTGGTYTRLATSDDIAFGTAVNQALTTP